MEQPGRGGADPLHLAQLLLGGFQDAGQVPEALEQGVGGGVGVPPGVGEIEQVLEDLVLRQALEAVLLDPLVHALAVPRVDLPASGHGRPLLCWIHPL